MTRKCLFEKWRILGVKQWKYVIFDFFRKNGLKMLKNILWLIINPVVTTNIHCYYITYQGWESSAFSAVSAFWVILRTLKKGHFYKIRKKFRVLHCCCSIFGNFRVFCALLFSSLILTYHNDALYEWLKTCIWCGYSEK